MRLGVCGGLCPGRARLIVCIVVDGIESRARTHTYTHTPPFYHSHAESDRRAEPNQIQTPSPAPSTYITPTGKGTLVYPDGSKLVGEFRDDQANGDGVLHFKNGDTYEGPFKVRSCVRFYGGGGWGLGLVGWGVVVLIFWLRSVGLSMLGCGTPVNDDHCRLTSQCTHAPPPP